MKNYFLLQFKRQNRKIIEFGLPLLVAYTVIPLVFILASNYLFLTTEFAVYIFVFIALSFVSKLSEPKKNSFFAQTLYMMKCVCGVDKYLKKH